MSLTSHSNKIDHFRDVLASQFLNIDGRKPPCKNHVYSSIRFKPHRRVTDRRTDERTRGHSIALRGKIVRWQFRCTVLVSCKHYLMLIIFGKILLRNVAIKSQFIFLPYLSTAFCYILKHTPKCYRRGTARCVVSVEVLPIATQQCRNYLYEKSWTKYHLSLVDPCDKIVL